MYGSLLEEISVLGGPWELGPAGGAYEIGTVNAHAPFGLQPVSPLYSFMNCRSQKFHRLRTSSQTPIQKNNPASMAGTRQENPVSVCSS